MRWNTSLLAALSLPLAACGGGGSYREAGPEPFGAPGTPAARSWSPPPEAEAWRSADGSVRRRPGAAASPDDLPPDEPLAEDIRPDAPPPPRGRRVQTAPQRPDEPDIDPAAGAAGPSGSSRQRPGELRHDEIGYAGIRPVAAGAAADSAVVAVHRSLPPGTVVEVTALATGRTALVLITGTMEEADRPMDLSAAAARLLGAGAAERLPVRIRPVTATPQDMALLRAGRPASAREDAPPVLLAALRKRLPAPIPGVDPAPRPARVPPRGAQRPAPPRPGVVPSGRFVVQIAALSNAANAQALARRLGGFVRAGGGLHRVQLGPFATRGQAEQARAGAARAGYGDARVVP
jgi:rare lipoprotein A